MGRTTGIKVAAASMAMVVLSSGAALAGSFSGTDLADSIRGNPSVEVLYG